MYGQEEGVRGRGGYVWTGGRGKRPRWIYIDRGKG